MTSRLIRAAVGFVATGALATTLISCSSSDDAAPTTAGETDSAVASESTNVPEAGPTTPASSADEAAITAVFQRYVDTSNAGDVQGYLATVCSTAPVQSQELSGGEPALYPMTVLDIENFAVEGDNALATVTVKIGLEDNANSITERFTFVREDGAWTVCGKQQG